MADNGHGMRSNSAFDDELSAALRRDVDGGGGPLGAGVQADLMGSVRRKRTSRAITATALTTVMVLGVGGLGWTVASNLGGDSPSPQVAAPTTTTPTDPPTTPDDDSNDGNDPTKNGEADKGDATTEGIAAADGRVLAFDWRNWQVEEAVEVSPRDNFTTSEGPLADVTLLGETSAAGVWFANRPTTADWRDLRFGTWSQADGFTPWTKTRDVAASAGTRFAPSVVVAGDDANQLVWIESEGEGTAEGDFWVFAADAATGTITVLATPTDTAGNTVAEPTVAARDGRAYWSSTQGGTYAIQSRALDGSGSITTVASNATLPVAGRDAVYAVQTAETAELSAIGIIDITDGAAAPFLTLTSPGDVPGLQVSAQTVVVITDATIYVVPQSSDHVVWTLAADDIGSPVLTSNGYLFWQTVDSAGLYTIYAADAAIGSDRIMRVNLCERSCGPSNSLRKLALGGAWSAGAAGGGGGATAWVTPADDAIQATGLILHWPLATMINEVG